MQVGIGRKVFISFLTLERLGKSENRFLARRQGIPSGTIPFEEDILFFDEEANSLRLASADALPCQRDFMTNTLTSIIFEEQQYSSSADLRSEMRSSAALLFLATWRLIHRALNSWLNTLGSWQFYRDVGLGCCHDFKGCTIQLNVQIEKEHDWREHKSGKSLPSLLFCDRQDSMHHWSRLMREVYRWKLLIVHSSSLY